MTTTTYDVEAIDDLVDHVAALSDELGSRSYLDPHCELAKRFAALESDLDGYWDTIGPDEIHDGEALASFIGRLQGLVEEWEHYISPDEARILRAEDAAYWATEGTRP